MYSQSVKVENKSGLHARPASLFVTAASKFQSKITVQKGTDTADAKSILYLISLEISKGTEIVISASGPDEEEAVTTLVNLIKSGMGEA